MSCGEVDEHITKLYTIRRRLGKGAYGIVWKAIDKRTKEIVAVKKIYDAFRNQTDAQRTYREIMFLREFGSHPNIIKLHAIHRASNNVDIYLIFEYMDTDLNNVIMQGNILKDIHKRFIMYQLLRATTYIHSGNVIHRDQKPSNILLDAKCRCKVADFGLARSVTLLNEGISDGMSDPSLTDYVATRWYRAPEILVASKRYTHGVDMWSLGCILGEMLLGKPLFPGSSTVNQVERILSSIIPPTQEEIASMGAGHGKWLVSRMPPGPRRPLADLLRDAPLDAVDLVSRLLVFNPHKRLTASEALKHPYVQRFANGEQSPLLKRDILPPFRDDVQLTVDDYRNKLYELMDNPKAPHIRKEPPRQTRHLSTEELRQRAPPVPVQRCRVVPLRRPLPQAHAVRRQTMPKEQTGDGCQIEVPKLGCGCQTRPMLAVPVSHMETKLLYPHQRTRSCQAFNYYRQTHGIVTASALKELHEKLRR